MRLLGWVVVVALVGLAACADDGQTPDAVTTIPLTATPVPAATPTTPSAGPSGSPSPSPTEPTPRDPTDADRARFIAGYTPSGVSDLRSVAVDLDADGTQEIVFGFVVDSEHRTQVDVASWQATAYEITAAQSGGPADDLTDLQVRDVNADGTTDIVLLQRVGASGSSASLWTAAGPGEIAPLTARGDCFDGGNTYGDTGVELTQEDDDPPQEIRATCEEPDLPAPLWPTVIYDWTEDGAYTCAYRETAQGLREDCRGGDPDAG